MYPSNLRRLISVAACVLFCPTLGAQDAAASAAEADAAPETVGPTIVVTGSRIPQVPDFVHSNPVTSVSAEQIENSGTTNLVEFLADIPALTGSLGSGQAAGSNAFVGGTGLELLDLRHLGVDRTLVLVDGRRHVAGLPGSAAVDIDTIPIALIQDVQVLTGGMSAIYGSDGVSGVVNFVTKRDFEGLDVRLQYGQSRHTEPAQMLASIVGGQSFGGGRGNFTAAFEYSGEDRMRASDRSYAGGLGYFGLPFNPGDPGDDPGLPDRIPLNDIRFFDSSRNGAVYAFDAEGNPLLFDGDGTPWEVGNIPRPDPSDPFSPPIDPFFQQGGDGTPQRDYIGDLLSEQERYTINTFLTWELSDRNRLYADLKYSRTTAFTLSSPTFDFFLPIAPDNPFIPAAINAASDGSGVFVSRDHFDFGVRGEDIERQTYRGVLGVDGDLTASTRFDASLVYGRVDVDNKQRGNRIQDRFFAALDAVDGPGGPTCRSNLDPDAAPDAQTFTPGAGSGCVPLNIFGEGSPSEEALAWIMTTSLATSRIQQTVAQASLSGKMFNLFAPGQSEMGWAVGVEHRREESEGHPAVEDQRGLTYNNVILPDHGEYRVNEMYLEVDVPLVEERRFAQYVGFDSALRFSDYNTIGTAVTWKVGSTWRVVDDVALRGTVARATRAPNISELFSPAGQTFQFIADPCDVNQLDSGTSLRRDNCAALLTGLGVDPDTYTDPNSSSVGGVLRGNRDLEEEEAETRTLGIVLMPRFAPGLRLSLDWYDIEIDNAINTALPEESAEICVDSPTLDNGFCSLVTREAGTGAIVDFVQQPLNVARLTTKGYDLSLIYLLDPAKMGWASDIGRFRLRLVGNKLEDLTFINLPGAPPDNDAGEGPRESGAFAPEWTVNLDLTWYLKRLEINYGYSYFDETQRFTRRELAGEPDASASRFFNYSQREVHDVFAAYRVLDTLKIYGGVNNLLDNEPDLGETAYPVSPIGRFFYAGVQIEM